MRFVFAIFVLRFVISCFVLSSASLPFSFLPFCILPSSGAFQQNKQRHYAARMPNKLESPGAIFHSGPRMGERTWAKDNATHSLPVLWLHAAWPSPVECCQLVRDNILDRSGYIHKSARRFIG